MQDSVSAARVDDPSVLHWSLPTRGGGGDVFATERAPGGALLHVLMADGNGNANASVSPLLAPFQRMTEKGYGIEAIARELNVTVRREPGRRFVAATLVAVDLGEGFVQVWNGGRPAPVLVPPAGQGLAEHDSAACRAFLRTHAPLGVRSDADLDDTVDVHAFSDGSQLFLCSEGLIEALDAAGARFGHARFLRSLEQSDADSRMQALHEAVTAHLAGQAATDVISVLRVDCRRLAAPAQAASVAATPGDAAVGVWRASLRISAQEIRRIDAVPVMLGLASEFSDTKEHAGKLFVVLSELYNNAVDHGLLRLDSGLKLKPDGMEAYLTERQSRLATLAKGEIHVELEELVGAGGNWLRIVCRDSGPGFNHSVHPRQPDAASEVPFGRGLMLLRAICPVFTFNELGNEATAILPLDESGKTS